jgi:hypothetical protein
MRGCHVTTQHPQSNGRQPHRHHPALRWTRTACRYGSRAPLALRRTRAACRYRSRAHLALRRTRMACRHRSRALPALRRTRMACRHRSRALPALRRTRTACRYRSLGRRHPRSDTPCVSLATSGEHDANATTKRHHRRTVCQTQAGRDTVLARPTKRRTTNRHNRLAA